MRGRILSGFLLTVIASGTARAATPRAPLQLDSDQRGDLLLYHRASGTWVNAYSDPNTPDRFVYTVGQWPAGFLIFPARLNEDGRSDAFLYNPETGAYAWAINTGSGYMLATGLWSANWTVHTADFNRDGLHDLLLYDAATGVWFQCLNTGGSAFAYHGGTWPAGRSLTAGDFNGDGRTDFFAYDAASGEWMQALATDTGVGFSTARRGTWSAGWQIHPVALNDDLLTDLFLYNPDDGIWFQAVSTTDASVFSYYQGRWSTAWQIFPADFDGDGTSDVFVYNVDSGLWFQCLTAAGGRGFRTYVGGRWSPDWQIVVSDFDGDSRSDIFVYNRTTGIKFQCVNTGDGQFTYRGGVWSPDWEIAGSMNRITVPPPPPPPPPALAVQTILAFGDSITFGSHSSRAFYLFERNHRDYPDTLGGRLQAQYPSQTIRVINAGSPGEMAAFARSRLEAALAASQPDLVLLLEGINDLNGGFTPAEVSSSLSTLVQAAQSRGVAVLIATLTPVSATYDPTGAIPAAIVSLNGRIASLAANLGLGPPVDLYGAFGSDPVLLSPDGLHPSDAGYDRIADRFYEAVVAAYGR